MNSSNVLPILVQCDVELLGTEIRVKCRKCRIVIRIWNSSTVVSSGGMTETIPPPGSQSSPYLVNIISKPANNKYATTFRYRGSMKMTPKTPRAFMANLSFPQNPRCLARKASLPSWLVLPLYKQLQSWPCYFQCT